MLPAIAAGVLALSGSAVIVDEYHQQNPTVVHITTVKKVPVPFAVVKIKYLPAKASPNFWATLINIESAGGKNRYRPSSTGKACTTTTLPCGHHQLSKQALDDIGCKTSACLANRDNFQKSQRMAHKYYNRLIQLGGIGKENWQKYIYWNQGPTGGKRIFAASQGKLVLPHSTIRNMANNSPYSFKTLNELSSKRAANKFLDYRREYWNKKRVEL